MKVTRIIIGLVVFALANAHLTGHGGGSSHLSGGNRLYWPPIRPWTTLWPIITTTPTAPTVTPTCNGQFLCGRYYDGTRQVEECVSSDKICNWVKDCTNGADEKHCPPKCYTQGKILCHDHKTCAVPCDRVRECPQGEDENCPDQCYCPDGYFQCNDTERKCLPASKLCDGKNDCMNGADEQNCPPTCTCGPQMYLCKDGQTCIPPGEFCEGTEGMVAEMDCPGGDDEQKCPLSCHCQRGEYLCEKFDEDDVQICLSGEVCNEENPRCPREEDDDTNGDTFC